MFEPALKKCLEIEKYLVTQLKNFKQGWRGGDPLDNYGQQMMSMSQVLTDEDSINNVVSHINTLGRD